MVILLPVTWTYLTTWEFCVYCLAHSVDCTEETSIKISNASRDGRGDYFIYLACKVLELYSKTVKKLCFKKLDSIVCTGNYC